MNTLWASCCGCCAHAFSMNQRINLANTYTICVAKLMSSMHTEKSGTTETGGDKGSFAHISGIQGSRIGAGCPARFVFLSECMWYESRESSGSGSKASMTWFQVQQRYTSRYICHENVLNAWSLAYHLAYGWSLHAYMCLHIYAPTVVDTRSLKRNCNCRVSEVG